MIQRQATALRYLPQLSNHMETSIRTAPPVVLDRLVRLLLRWICRKLVKQGPLHRARIFAYYLIMREAAESFLANNPTLPHLFAERSGQPKSGRSKRRLGIRQLRPEFWLT